MKKLIVLLLFVEIVFGATNKTSWTVNLFTIDSMKKVNYYINKHIKYPAHNIYIFKEKNKYRVTYGLFTNYREGRVFMNNQSSHIQIFSPYVLRHKYDLYNPQSVPTLVKVIRFSKGKKRVNNSISQKKQTPKQIQKERVEIEDKKEYKSVSKKQKRIVSDEYIYGVSLKYAKTNLSGDIKLQASDSSVDFENDLGLDGSSTNVVPELSIQKGKHKLFVSYFSVQSTKTQMLQSDITLENTLISQGSNVSSNLELSYLKYGYQISLDSYDLGINLHTVENKIDIVPNSNPIIHINGSYDIISLSLDKEYLFNDKSLFVGINIGKGEGVDYLNYKIGGSYYFNENLLMTTGYDVENLEINNNNYMSNIDLNHWYLQITKRF